MWFDITNGGGGASDVSYAAVSPALAALDVSPATDLAFAVTAPSMPERSTLSITIDGVAACVGGQFVRTVATGTVAGDGTTTLRVRFTPRRHFLYSVRPAVVVGVGSFSTEGVPLYFTYDFLVRSPPRTLLDATLQRTAVDVPNASVGVEAFRRVLLGAIKAPGASSLVSLVYRVANSPLRGILYAVPVAAPAVDELTSVRGVDLGGTDAAFAALARLAPLWEAALAELTLTGVETEIVRLVFQLGRSPNPADQVAAACALVLLGTPA